MQKAKSDINRTSYWLPTSQTVDVEHEEMKQMIALPPERPSSPFTEQPLRRKEIWSVQLLWYQRSSTKKVLVCAISQKSITSQQAIAYWIDKDKPGTIVLESVYNDLVVNDGNVIPKNRNDDEKIIDHNEKTTATKLICPLTSRKIKYVRYLQKSGSSFASSGQNIQVKQYRPTIT